MIAAAMVATIANELKPARSIAPTNQPAAVERRHDLRASHGRTDATSNTTMTSDV